ncbi:hypothetical protein [Acidovorax soli]|uniref:Uncharacterized protein n=3 Tax=Comamonadaceae TaxID=80864 RepID=A0A1H4EBR4_9BURK|nr:hypothetical protein [Acidovorax soli]SEA82178.1 hypothetical protein SAMN05421875_13312 [Acidovorax soli]
MAAVHPRTLLGAARAMLQPAVDERDQHLQAQAACLLGDYQSARRLWEALAQNGDGEALERLLQLAQRGPREAAALSGPRYPR